MLRTCLFHYLVCGHTGVMTPTSDMKLKLFNQSPLWDFASVLRYILCLVIFIGLLLNLSVI